MAVLKFTVERSGDLTATVAQGRYRIIDFGREGWNASFTPTGGPEVALAPFKGGPFHANSKHAAARCHCTSMLSAHRRAGRHRDAVRPGRPVGVTAPAAAPAAAGSPDRQAGHGHGRLLAR